MNLEDFDFSVIAKTGCSIEQFGEAMKVFHAMFNPPNIITAPDGIPISDTEYAGLELGNCYSMDSY